MPHKDEDAESKQIPAPLDSAARLAGKPVSLPKFRGQSF